MQEAREEKGSAGKFPGMVWAKPSAHFFFKHSVIKLGIDYKKYLIRLKFINIIQLMLKILLNN